MVEGPSENYDLFSPRGVYHFLERLLDGKKQIVLPLQGGTKAKPLRVNNAHDLVDSPENAVTIQRQEDGSLQVQFKSIHAHEIKAVNDPISKGAERTYARIYNFQLVHSADEEIQVKGTLQTEGDDLKREPIPLRPQEFMDLIMQHFAPDQHNGYALAQAVKAYEGPDASVLNLTTRIGGNARTTAFPIPPTTRIPWTM